MPSAAFAFSARTLRDAGDGGDGRCMAHNLVATGSVSLRQDMIGTKMQPPVGNGPAAHYERPVSSHSCHDLHR
jgi:hypothetical protein